MIQIYQKYNELNININKKDKLNKKKKKLKNKKKENKKSFFKSFLKWTGIVTGIIIGIMIFLAFFMSNPHHSNNPKKSSSSSSQQIQTKHQNKKNLKINNISVNIKSTKIKNSVKNVIKNSVKNVDMNPLLNKIQKQANGNKNSNQIKIPDSNQTKQVKQKIKYKTVLFCKNITPLNNQVIYFVKIADKMVPVYTLNNWNGKGIKFKAYELKKMLSKIIIDNKTYYEVQKGKYLISTKNSIKCFTKKVEVKNGNN